MLRYASSLLFGLLMVFTLLVVMQSFVVGRQFQFTAGGGTAASAVVNLSSENTLGSQITTNLDKSNALRSPPLPEDLAMARLAPPDVTPPALGLPAFRPPFAAVAAENIAESSTETSGSAAPTPAAATAPAAQPVLAVGDIVLVERVEPKFPTQAIREGITTGSVTVKFTVETDGSVSNPEVIDAKPRRGIFDDAALRAVRNWKFKPLPAPRDSSVIVDFNQGGG
ncbi:MAG TPA: energy transducer TonB [Gammaproteobacteria bacterium]|nr:energy transducer TonB [Gammaproteobacteria bacterium]